MWWVQELGSSDMLRAGCGRRVEVLRPPGAQTGRVRWTRVEVVLEFKCL